MRPIVRSLAAFATTLFASGAVFAAAEPPPPTDAELTKFIAVQRSLSGDAARAEQICTAMAESSQSDSGASDDLAAAGRKADAHPILGPVLRTQGVTGRRYIELSVQVAGVLIGAAIADDADAGARKQGKPATNRDTLLASTPSAKPILDRQAELTTALQDLQTMCEGDESDEYSDDEPEEEGEE